MRDSRKAGDFTFWLIQREKKKTNYKCKKIEREFLWDTFKNNKFQEDH